MSRTKRRFSYSQMDYLIGEYITGKNSERNREILREHFLKGYTQAQIAQLHDMSDVQVGRIIRKEGDYLLMMLE